MRRLIQQLTTLVTPLAVCLTAAAPAFAADTTPPTVRITSPSSGDYFSGVGNNSSDPFTLDGSGSRPRTSFAIDADAADDVGVARVEFYVDGVNRGADTDGAPWRLAAADLPQPDGPHSLRATAFDEAGNSSQSDEVVVNRDTVAPTIERTPKDDIRVSTGANQVATRSQNVEIGFGISPDAYTCSFSVVQTFPARAQLASPPCQPPSALLALGAAADGSYSVEIAAIDRAGNRGVMPFELVVDRSAANVITNVDGVGAGKVRVVARLIAGDWPATTELAMDGGAFKTVVDEGLPGLTFLLEGVPAGSHTVVTRMSDWLGNVETSAPVAFTLAEDGTVSPGADTVAPALSTSGSASAAAIAVTVGCRAEACSVTFTGTLSTGGASKVFRLAPTKIKLAKGKKATVRLKLPRGARSAVRAALRAGRHPVAAVSVRARDASGNVRQRKLKFVLRH